MFRELVRKKQQLSQEEAIAVLKQEPRGVLSLQGDDGYPYGIPMDHFYNEADGCIYFHCGNRATKTMPLPAATRFPTVSWIRGSAGRANGL